MSDGGISPMYGRVSAETLNTLRLLDSFAVANAVDFFDQALTGAEERKELLLKFVWIFC
jgi:hypothetical protein